MLYSPVTPSYVFEIEVWAGTRQPTDDEIEDDEERKPINVWTPKTFRLTGSFALSPVQLGDQPDFCLLESDGKEYILNASYDDFRAAMFVEPQTDDDEDEIKPGRLH